MNDFNARWKMHRRRVRKKVAEAGGTDREGNPGVHHTIPERRSGAGGASHSTKALRVASEKLSEFADYMEKHPHPPK